MLASQLITALYLLSLSDQSNALPMSAPHYHGPNFGHEQTTQQSRPTTTIDYDLADFDEFGNDPGIYDVAGSPDIINIVDDNDQGYDYQTGIAIGQSWHEPLYTVSPGVSRFPGGSGGISDEVQESFDRHSEGGPTDEGSNPKTNRDQSVRDRQMPDNNDNRSQQPEKSISISDKNKQKTTDASLSVGASISSLKDIVLPLNSTEENYNVSTGHLSNERDRNRDDGESRKQSDNGRVTSTSPDSSRNGRTGSKQAADQISQPKKHSSVRSGDSTRDKYSDVSAGAGGVAGETTGHISQPKNLSSDRYGGSTRDKYSGVSVGADRETTGHVSQRKQDSSVHSGSSTQDYSDAASGSGDVSEESAETSLSSEDFSDSKNSSMSDESSNNYSVFDSNSQDHSSTSRSVEHNESEGISSMEDLSGEIMRSGVKTSSRHSQDTSVSKVNGISGDDKLDSLVISEQNGIYSTEYDDSRSSVNIDGSHSSKPSGSHSSSGESDSKSVETSDSNFPSDESGSRSAEMPGSQSLSDESGSQSVETSGSQSDSSSDENSSQSKEHAGSASSSDESGSQYTEEFHFKSSFEDTTESDRDLPETDFHYSTQNDQFAKSITLSPGTKYTENHSDNADGGSDGKTSATQADELAKCFAPSVDDGKYCYLLRSLYSICNFQFKNACATSNSKEKQSNDKASTYYNPNSFRYISDDSSSESTEESDSVSYITSIGSSSSLQSSSNSLSIETVENLSASFERSDNIFEVFSLIKDTCPSICALAESYSQNTTGKHHGLNRGNIESVEDYDSSDSMDEDDFTETSNEAFSDSDEDETGRQANSNNDVSRKAQSQEFSDSDEYQPASQTTYNNVASEKAQSEASEIQGEAVNNINKGDYSIEDNTNESSVDISFASGSNSKYSAESSGGQSFEYNSGTSDSASK